ncbi:MAG: C-GCAxxG-C-C family protein [Candidatus Odinarchaeota archaeon]
MSRLEKAISNFEDNCNCAQSVLSSFSTDFGLNKETALRIATGFGGGMARFGRTCGAVSGAYMVIGLRYGMGSNEEVEMKEKTYEVIQEFSKRFQKLHGSELCKELIGCDLSTSEGREYFSQNELSKKKCFHYIKNAVEILEELL